MYVLLAWTVSIRPYVNVYLHSLMLQTMLHFVTNIYAYPRYLFAKTELGVVITTFILCCNAFQYHCCINRAPCNALSML